MSRWKCDCDESIDPAYVVIDILGLACVLGIVVLYVAIVRCAS